MGNVMIDIETYSSETNAQIVQIGSVTFALGTPKVMTDNFLVNVDPEDDENLKRDKSFRTMDWWRDQSPQAKERLKYPPRMGFRLALELLASHITSNDDVWAWSPQFDLSILRHAYAQIGMKCPWHYRAERDARTIWNILPKPARDAIEKEVREMPLVEHYALHDAIGQARSMQLALEYIRSQRW